MAEETAFPAAGGRRLVAPFVAGLLISLTTPGIILLASSAGFGALARDAGMSLFNAVFMMGAFFALPAQVVMMDQLARGGSLLAGVVAVALTAVRLVPMAVLLAPLIKDGDKVGWRQVLAVHSVAVTAWIEGVRRLPEVDRDQRVSHFLGIGAGFIAVTLIGTAAGFLLAGSVPAIIAATLLFLTPIYFFVSLIATAFSSADRLAILFGTMIGPVTYVLMPGFDLLVAGVAGGTAAFVLGRRWDRLWEDGEE